MGAAPHSTFHLRFPIEKKNFYYTPDLLYRLLGQ